MSKNNETKESVLQKILYGVSAAILIGAVTFFGASIQSAVSKINENNVEIVLIKKDLETILKDLQNSIGKTADTSAEVKNLEIQVTRLEEAIKRLEK
jgi:hypothetical protein